VEEGIDAALGMGTHRDHQPPSRFLDALDDAGFELEPLEKAIDASSLICTIVLVDGAA